MDNHHGVNQCRYHSRLGAVVSVLALLLLDIAPGAAQSPFLGEIDLVPFNFAMKGYAECNGQLLSISQNTALFSLLGTTYGGDGKTTFALPDLRDRIPIHLGQGPGLSNYVEGERGGESSHTLVPSEMPGHTHALAVSGAIGTTSSPANGVMAGNAATFASYSATPNTTMSQTIIQTAGGGQPHNNLQPYLGLKFVIALQGIYPSRP